MTVTWLIEDFHSENGFDRLVKEVTRQGHKAVPINYMPFDNMAFYNSLPHDAAPTVVQSSIGEALAIQQMAVQTDRLMVPGPQECFLSPAAVKWFADSFAKICVYVNSEEELEAVYRQAMEAGLPAALCVDNGLTEFGGVATKTVVAIGPDYSEKIDKITGELPLF